MPRNASRSFPERTSGGSSRCKVIEFPSERANEPRVVIEWLERIKKQLSDIYTAFNADIHPEATTIATTFACITDTQDSVMSIASHVKKLGQGTELIIVQTLLDGNINNSLEHAAETLTSFDGNTQANQSTAISAIRRDLRQLKKDFSELIRQIEILEEESKDDTSEDAEPIDPHVAHEKVEDVCEQLKDEIRDRDRDYFLKLNTVLRFVRGLEPEAKKSDFRDTQQHLLDVCHLKKHIFPDELFSENLAVVLDSPDISLLFKMKYVATLIGYILLLESESSSDLSRPCKILAMVWEDWNS